jgi:hypothetical protein
MDITDKKCPDCGRTLRAIKILDNAQHGVRPAQEELTYMAPEAKQSFWTGRYPVGGGSPPACATAVAVSFSTVSPARPKGPDPSAIDAGEPVKGSRAEPVAAADRPHDRCLVELGSWPRDVPAAERGIGRRGGARGEAACYWEG